LVRPLACPKPADAHGVPLPAARIQGLGNAPERRDAGGLDAAHDRQHVGRKHVGSLSPTLVSSEHWADKDSEKRRRTAIPWHLPRQGQRNKFGTGLTSGPLSDDDEYWITAQTSSAATASRSHQNISRFFGSGGGYGFGMSLGGTLKLAIIGGNRGIQTAQGRAQSAMRSSS
jgi:hypothetical protein